MYKKYQICRVISLFVSDLYIVEIGVFSLILGIVKQTNFMKFSKIFLILYIEVYKDLEEIEFAFDRN